MRMLGIAAALAALSVCFTALAAASTERSSETPWTDALSRGNDRDPRIVGGVPTTIAQYPWQVAVAANDDFFPGDGDDRQFCGGTLVVPTIVITAAHCTFEVFGGSGFDDPSNFEVFAGRTTLSSSEGQAIDVAELYYFEGSAASPVLQSWTADPDTAADQLYNPDTNEWDAVFFLLEASSTTGTPIKIAGADEAATWVSGTTALISGWGDHADGAGNFPDQLHAARVPITDDTTCVSNYAAFNVPIVPQVMVCAGFPQGGVDTCQGDSGGPLVVAVEEGAGGAGTRLIGDTSFGLGCAQPNLPGVYGRLASDPMRFAFAAGIQQVAGVNIVGSGARPIAPPETAIGKHPKKLVKTRKRRAKARFTFSANEPASFQCKLDKKAFKPCSSPFKKKVKAGKKGGKPKKHKFHVVAIDTLGQGDASAATFKWRVKRLGKRRR